mmetsp:Transcript_60290/g.179585  ORF Transcript_60290/g.179585 Transcript_60290/m.179585 type:complete len:324 (-) Transcript_60290:617-1588(-)
MGLRPQSSGRTPSHVSPCFMCSTKSRCAYLRARWASSPSKRPAAVEVTTILAEVPSMTMTSAAASPILKWGRRPNAKTTLPQVYAKASGGGMAVSGIPSNQSSVTFSVAKSSAAASSGLYSAMSLLTATCMTGSPAGPWMASLLIHCSERKLTAEPRNRSSGVTRSSTNVWSGSQNCLVTSPWNVSGSSPTNTAGGSVPVRVEVVKVMVVTVDVLVVTLVVEVEDVVVVVDRVSVEVVVVDVVKVLEEPVYVVVVLVDVLVVLVVVVAVDVEVVDVVAVVVDVELVVLVNVVVLVVVVVVVTDVVVVVEVVVVVVAYPRQMYL